MAYTYDSKNVGTSIIPEGNYECVISDAKTMTSSVKGTPGINLTLTVRNDVEQECKNRTMFDTFWLSDKARPYSEKKMNTISTCGNFENGREFDSDDAWCAAIIGVAVLAVVKNRFDDYAGEDKAVVSYYKRTEQPEVKHVWKDGTAPASGGYVEVSTDDLPFQEVHMIYCPFCNDHLNYAASYEDKPNNTQKRLRICEGCNRKVVTVERIEYIHGAERCVSCGVMIPGGRQVCPKCERG